MLTLVVIAAILIGQALAIQPWGAFPLNDDWGHALLTRHWAQSGHFAAFIPITPSLVIQAFCGKEVIRFFGFSHAALRALNLSAAFLFAVLLDRILCLLSVRREWRWLALVVWLTNPLVTLLSFTFMSDIFGLLVAYTGVWLWFEHRRALARHGWNWQTETIVLVAAAIMGFSFWTRQLSVLVFGGVALSQCVLSWREWRILLRRYLLTAVVFVLPVLGYFAWARRSGNLNPDFTHKLELQGIGNIGDILMQVVVWAIYQTAFCLPLLLLVAQPARWRRSRFWILCLAIALVALANFHYGNQDYRLKASIHAHFPILGNDLNPYGIGPITLTDVYLRNEPLRPAFWRWPWIVFELLVLALLPVWGEIGTRARRLPRPRLDGWAFGLSTIAVTWFINSIFFGKGTFDRYVLAAFPALLIALLSAVGTEPISPRRKPIFFLALAIYVYYGVGGTHDYFRWNEARWDLLRFARMQGIADNQVDGGYEMNAWNHFQSYPALGEANCATPYWFCANRRYTIGFNPPPGSRLLAQAHVASWLGTYPSLQLLDTAAH